MKESLGIPKTSFVFGAVGRLNIQKGFKYLLESFSKFLLKDPYSYLIIIGDGPEKKYLERYIHEKNVKNVLLLGYQKNVNDYYSIMDCFVMPSLFEGFGLVAVEALIKEVPVVASDVDSIPEIIGSNEFGLLCKPKDVEDLLEKMDFAYENIDVMQQKAVRGKKYVIKNFSLAEMCDQHFELYREVCG